MVSGKISRDRGAQAAEAAAMRPTPEHPILLDDAVARYVFDYKVPPDFLDIEFAAPFPKSHVVGQMRPGDVYLAGPANVAVLKEFTLLDLAVPYWVPFSLPNRHVSKFPCQVFIIPEETCNGLRAEMKDK